MSREAGLKAASTRRARRPAQPIALSIEPGRLSDYTMAHDVALLEALRAEQIVLDGFAEQYQRGQWSRLQDNGTTVSGCSKSGGRGKLLGRLAAARLHRIEVELERRGFSPEQIAEHRHGDHETMTEREGLMLDEGDTTFQFSEAV